MTTAALKAVEELAEEANGNGNDWELFCLPRLELIRAELAAMQEQTASYLRQAREANEELVGARELGVVVDKQGVSLGKYYWVSHETITGCVAARIPKSHKQYWDWCCAMIDAARREGKP